MSFQCADSDLVKIKVDTDTKLRAILFYFNDIH